MFNPIQSLSYGPRPSTRGALKDPDYSVHCKTQGGGQLPSLTTLLPPLFAGVPPQGPVNWGQPYDLTPVMGSAIEAPQQVLLQPASQPHCNLLIIRHADAHLVGQEWCQVGRAGACNIPAELHATHRCAHAFFDRSM